MSALQLIRVVVLEQSKMRPPEGGPRKQRFHLCLSVFICGSMPCLGHGLGMMTNFGRKDGSFV